MPVLNWSSDANRSRCRVARQKHNGQTHPKRRESWLHPLPSPPQLETAISPPPLLLLF